MKTEQQDQQKNPEALLYRTFDIERAAMKDDERTVELSFSSEDPIETFNWDHGRVMEILDHGSSSVNMERMKRGAPLLVEHDRRDQVGVVEEARIDPDKRGRAKVRFGKSERANEIFQDVRDGIRRLVSVGYRVHEWVTEKIEENGLNTIRAISWTPMEISIVSVPADLSVGIGRSEKTDGNKTKPPKEDDMKLNAPSIRLSADAPGGAGGASAPSTPAPPDNSKQRQTDMTEMFSMARHHKVLDLYNEALEKEWDVNQFRSELLKKIKTVDQPDVNFRATPGPQKSLGEILTTSEAYRNAIAAGKHRNMSMEVPILGTRATLLTSTGVTGYDRPPGITLLEQQPLTIAQLFAQGETTQPTIRILQEASYTQAATAVAEEGLKPEASFDLVETDFTVRKIAVTGRVSDEMFADFPSVRDYVNGRLVWMVQSKEDSELLNGNGTPPRITGVLNTSGISTEASGSSPTIADAIHKGITKVRSTGFFSPDAIVMHPTDWQNLRLSKDSNGQYYAGGPFGGAYGVGGYTANGPLWGLPVVVTTAISQGTALVGAFRIGGQLFRRMGVTIDTTNSDASDFVYNRICIRVETRLALVIYRPLAFCTVTGIPA